MEARGFTYAGDELSIFARATRWKEYIASQTRPYIAGRVLEVGAGIGATTLALWQSTVDNWTALEPDVELSRQAVDRYRDAGLATAFVRPGTLAGLDRTEKFDAILYIDVLEHIDDDAAELRAAARHLANGGRLIVLAPAYQWLYSPFDAAIGHHRRYTGKMLQAVCPPGLIRLRLRYLDAIGVCASLANRVLLRRTLPGTAQLLIWDRLMVPGSRLLDPFLGYAVGRSVLAVWQKPTSAA